MAADWVSLDQTKNNCKGRIMKVEGKGCLRRRLLELGLVAGTECEVAGRAPFGGPIRIRVRGYDLTLRKCEARQILVQLS